MTDRRKPIGDDCEDFEDEGLEPQLLKAPRLEMDAQHDFIRWLDAIMDHCAHPCLRYKPITVDPGTMYRLAKLARQGIENLSEAGK